MKKILLTLSAGILKNLNPACYRKKIKETGQNTYINELVFELLWRPLAPDRFW